MRLNMDFINRNLILMKIKRRNVLTVCILAALFLLSGGFCKIDAQTFDEARNYAFNGDRVKARAICREILSKGFNSDVALLLGRTYSWDGKYDSARVIFIDIQTRMPENQDVFDALADVEYWSGNYSKAIEYCDQIINKSPEDEAVTLKKARILYSSSKFKEATAILETFIGKYQGHPEVLKKLQEYRLDVLKNTIQLSYTLDNFENEFNRDPWQIAALSYGRKTKFGSLITRVNLAKRYGDVGFQFEMDVYPRISENNYAYLNYGFSPSSIFPENRLGFEWYHNFPKSFEGSLGMRLLFFGGSNVGVYTATVGKYAGNYWLSLRSFVTPSSGGTSVSGLLQARRYFSDPENYVGLRLGYGISPDDNRNLIDSSQKLSLKTRSLRVEYNHIFNHIWILKTGAVWGMEELHTSASSGYYTFDISISRLF